MSRLSASSARGKQAAKRKRPIAKRHRIDFADIPELSNAQLRAMRRVGRPPLGEYARQLIAIRVDPQVLAEVKKEAKRRDVGYQTLINDILAKHAKSIASLPSPLEGEGRVRGHSERVLSLSHPHIRIGGESMT